MFEPEAIYFEKNIENYKLGKELLKKYNNIPKFEIDNHNNIEEMRKKQNKEFPYIKLRIFLCHIHLRDAQLHAYIAT